MNQDLESFLRSVTLLRSVTADTLEAFAAASVEVELAPGDVLFREGDPGEFLFIVREGALEALKDNSRGESVVLRALGRGDVGGVTSITLGRPRSATLRARQHSRLLRVPARDAEKLLTRRPDLSRSLIAMLSEKLRTKTRAIAEQLTSESDGRFRIAFFDVKPYEQEQFEPRLGDDLSATFFAPRLDPRTAELCQGHQAACCFVHDEVSRPTLEALARAGVGIVALRCAGYNNVDVAAAEELGLAVVRVPAYSPHAVAEHALALVLTLNRKTHRAYNRVREGNFRLDGLVGSDLHGQTAGLIGLGAIGRCCARIFAGFGMRVLAHDVKPDPEFAHSCGIELAPLDQVIEQSDVISLHCPLLPTTRHLIDAERIAQMKPGVMIVNTSRGALIDTKALINGLKSGQVGSAGLDVYEEEDHYFFEDRSAEVITDDVLARLMTFNNVLVTSHQGFLTRQALESIAETTLDNVRRYREGQPLANAVKP